MSLPSKPWIVVPGPRRSPALRLVCFANAGSGVSPFVRWAGSLPQSVELAAVRLPGRETRIKEAPLTSMEEIARCATEAIRPLCDVPLYLLGHSMGACVAYEVSRRLHREHGIHPVRLMAVTARAPHLPSPLAALWRLSDEDLAKALARHNGIPSELLADVGTLRIVMPAIRGDLLVLDRYRVPAIEPLATDLCVVGGDADPLVRRDDLMAWKAYASKGFALRMFQGGHFFIRDRWRELVDILIGPAAT